MRPSAKKFLVRSFCLRRHLEALERALVERRDRDLEHGELLERAVRRAGSTRRPPSSGSAAVNASLLTISVPPAGRSPMFVLSAAGFIATSTSGASPGVWMSLALKLIWKPETPGQRAGGGPDLRREVGERADVVAEDGGGPGELGAGELHAVAGVAGEPDGDAIELLDVVLDRASVVVVIRLRPAPCADAVWVGGSAAPRGTTPRGT